MPRMTQAEVNAYEARQRKPSRFAQALQEKYEQCTDESELHQQIFDECRRRGWIVLHVVMSERTYRTLGEPDFVILASKKVCSLTMDADLIEVPRIYLIECKTRTGKLSPAQQAMHAHAAKLGHTVHVVRSFGEFLKLL